VEIAMKKSTAGAAQTLAIENLKKLQKSHPPKYPFLQGNDRAM
jgi:hypothetical protein